MTENESINNTIQTTNTDSKQVAGILVGGSVLTSLYLLIKKSRNFFSWLIPIGLLAAGTSLYFSERQKQIKQTGDQIMAQLDELDPIAKAEVVKYLADQEMERLK
jgi:hypothetical protein